MAPPTEQTPTIEVPKTSGVSKPKLRRRSAISPRKKPQLKRVPPAPEVSVIQGGKKTKRSHKKAKRSHKKTRKTHKKTRRVRRK